MLNNIVKTVLNRAGPSLLRSKKDCLKSMVSLPAYSRAVWHMSSRIPLGINNTTSSELCNCGCRSLIHTNGERELVNFLTEEIAAEKKAQKLKTLPKELSGFTISTDGAEITLKKANEGETICINLNVNHSVDTDVEPELNTKADNPEIGDLKARPNFEVDITRGGKTLSFTCSFTGAAGAEADDGYCDAFGIDEVTFFEGEWKEETYAVAGDVLDGNLYDLFMTILEEKGISNEFADKLSEIATSYEHSCYIGLLEKLSNFSK